VQVIAAVICGQQAIEVLRVTNDGIEIDDRIEVAGGANPCVHCLPVGLA